MKRIKNVAVFIAILTLTGCSGGSEEPKGVTLSTFQKMIDLDSEGMDMDGFTKAVVQASDKPKKEGAMKSDMNNFQIGQLGNMLVTMAWYGQNCKDSEQYNAINRGIQKSETFMNQFLDINFMSVKQKSAMERSIKLGIGNKDMFSCNNAEQNIWGRYGDEITGTSK